MDTYLAVARDNRLAGLVALVIVAVIGYAIYRVAKRRQRRNREAAWRAKRVEQDRIWSERVTNK